MFNSKAKIVKKIRCLITAGATREHFDPVRFISNPSTGKMGWHIAKASQENGWQTTLVMGASPLPEIDGVETIKVVSAQDMLEACQSKFPDCDILIMSAAVSDVRPKKKATNKVKKDAIDLHPELERTPDILLTLSKEKKNQILIGFAAETNDVIAYAKDKLERKNLNAIVANDVSAQNIGFASDMNKIDIVCADGSIFSPELDTKENLARTIIKFVEKLLQK
ncbi:MAG: phosphopantothenoylcysteine decarboxylase [Verrucomicrobiaceae bacterium]|nr:phosphopantothenoylcysteine decarboxylase [Verrucomicrobiaceae bacterium]